MVIYRVIYRIIYRVIYSFIYNLGYIYIFIGFFLLWSYGDMFSWFSGTALPIYRLIGGIAILDAPSKISSTRQA